MCGIVGFNWDDGNLLRRMMNSIAHRGPDDEGYYSDKNVSLANKRLNVIDLETGKQPIYNEDGSMVIVYNGEIYNYKELRKNLESKGHKFSTSSDTEVIVHSYEEYGFDCCRKFNGMFAFAIWDSNKKQLFIGRDRFGIKPLYYYFKDSKLLFASEIKAILEYVKPTLNYKAFLNYMTFRYCPLMETMFQDINELNPGHYLVYAKDEITVKKYWGVNLSIVEDSLDHNIRIVRELINSAIERSLVSDVPFGAFLSGGLDSSVLVGIMSKYLDEPVKTFSVGFETSDFFNEANYARELAEYYDTEHHELIVKSDCVYKLPEAIWHLDTLVSDPTILAQKALAEYTKKYVTVVLTGEGADELFGGYPEFKFMYYGNRFFKNVPNIVKNNFPSFINNVPDKFLDIFFKFSSSLGERGKERFSNFIRYMDDPSIAYLNLISFFNSDDKRELYSEELWKKEIEFRDYYDQLRYYFNKDKLNLFNKLILIDMKRRLPNFLLHKMDKMSMAHAVEARVPFLDNNLVGCANSFPINRKLKNLNEKFILKKAMKDIIPKTVIKRKKHPFVVPMGSWYNENIKEMAKIIFDSSKLKIFNKVYLDKILRDYEKSPIYYGRQLWSILSFDVWYKIYMEENKKLDFNKLY